MDGTSKKIQQFAERGGATAHDKHLHRGSHLFSAGRRAVDVPAYDVVLARRGYKVRLADTSAQRSQASMLIKSMYTWRGYCVDDLRLPSQDPYSITLEASSGRQLYGTLTLGLDSEHGLLADQLYKAEIDDLRNKGCRICEMTKLAFDPLHSSKEIIASLFHLAYIYAHKIYQGTDLLIEVNPRHVGFYQNRLGFRQLGDVRTCRRVNAPAVLLHVELEYVGSKIATCAGLHDSEDKSLYPYFFSQSEAQGLTSRIRRAS